MSTDLTDKRFADVPDAIIRIGAKLNRWKQDGWEIIDDIRWTADNLCHSIAEKEVFYQDAGAQWEVSPKTIRNYVSITRSLGAQVAQELELSFDHANAVLGLDQEVAEDLLYKAAEKGWSGDRLRQMAWVHKNDNRPGARNCEHPPTEATKIANDGADFSNWRFVRGALGNYYQLDDTKKCAVCQKMWAADLDYCPYCHLSPEVRGHYASLPLKPQVIRPISDTDGYDGDEWYTPAEYIEAARVVMGGIDLDPASCGDAQVVVNAEAYLTKFDNALRDDCHWHGRVWLNPPYSMPLIRDFVAKLIGQYTAGNIEAAIVITNNSSDTGWFHELLQRYPACFTRGRVSFWRPNHDDFGTRQGQTLFYLGNDLSAFVQEFSKFGRIVRAL